MKTAETGKPLLAYQLQFFAKDGPGGEKTEQPTAKKLRKAREEGQVAKSREVGNAFGLITFFILLKNFVETLGRQMVENFGVLYNKMPGLLQNLRGIISVSSWTDIINNMLVRTLVMLLPFLAVGFFVAFVVELAQVKWQPTTKPLRPKFSKLNPLKGFQRFFSKAALFELVKSMLKIVLILYVAYSVLNGEKDNLYKLYDIPLLQVLILIGGIAIEVGLRISLVYLIIALLDFIYQKIKFKNDMMMTKQEVKDEYKNVEGNPEIKGRQRSKMREASQRRMMSDMKNADVVITNPTHLAVALKYDAGENAAPVVLAKGEDYLAAKIRETAKENNIEIVENKPLARMLYVNVEIGAMIPPELYQAVAEVLAYVYSVKKK